MNEKKEKEENNKSKAFKEKLAIFQDKKQNSQLANFKKPEFKSNKEKINKNNENGNIEKNNKPEEKSKEPNKVSIVINHPINKKEETNKIEKTDSIENKKEQTSFKNNNFQQNLNVFNSSKQNKEKNNNDKENTNKKETTKTQTNNNKNKEPKAKTNEENKKEEKNNDLSLAKEKSSQNFQKKTKQFEQNSNNDENKKMKKENSQKNIIKDKNSDIKDKIQSMFVSKELNEDIKTKNTMKQKTQLKINAPNENENNMKYKKYESQNNINKNINIPKKSITDKIHIFDFKMGKKEIKNDGSKENDNESLNKTINVRNSIQQRIIDLQKNNSDNKDKEDNKQKLIKKNRIDQSILERLKLLYQSKEEDSRDKHEKNNNKNIENSKNIMINEENKNDKSIQMEKEIPTEKLASMKMEMHINDIRNKNKKEGYSQLNIPKKLNLNEIFKKMNIDQFASIVKADKREEIIKCAKQKKEEEDNIDKIVQEEELEHDIEKNIDNNIDNEVENEEGILEDNNLDNNISPEEEKMKFENQQILNDNDNSLYNYVNSEPNDEDNSKDGSKKEKKRKKFSINFNKFFKGKKSFFKKNKKTPNTEKDEKSGTKNDNIEKDDVSRKLLFNDNDEPKSSRASNPYINRISNPCPNTIRNNSTLVGNESIIKGNKILNKQISKSKFYESNTENKNNMRCTLQTSKSSILFYTDKKKANDQIEDIFIEMINTSENDQKINDNFCQSFFLASFPYENAKVIENSEKDLADCQHSLCSELHAMQPEIIYKYPKEDVKGLELNNLAASICFPNGIKVCYEEEEEKIKTVRNYRSSFTNQVGERFFAVTYHFFLKMLNNDYVNYYSMTPMRYQLIVYQDEICAGLNDELEEDIYKKLEIYSKLNFRENVYIPFCLCLISKYPFYEQMEKCLESIMITINNYDTTPQELNHLITYIVKSIPAPPIKSKVLFALPYINRYCEIQNPYFEDILQFGDNPIIIFKYLSINNIICLFKLLIFEQKILVVGKDNDSISQIILNFVSLLYPYEWIHTYIPIMSEKMLKFLQAFLPFFNGMNISLYKKARSILAKAPKGVFIINIDEDTIDINTNLRKNAKHIKGNAYINRYLYNLPKNIENLLIKELKSIKNDYENTQNHNYDNYEINIRIKNLFLHVFVEILYDYNKYSHIIDNFPVFNSFLLINDKPKNDRNFYKELTSTQLFQMFIQNSFLKDEDKKIYFDERIKEYLELKEKGDSSRLIYTKLENNFKNQYQYFLEIDKNYIIKPFFIKNFDKFEEKYTKKNKKLKFRDINTFLFKQYDSYNNYLNNQGVLKENKRIVGRTIKLTHDNDPTNYNIFIIPEKNINLINNLKESSNKKNENEDIPETSVGNSSSKKKQTTRMRIISGDGNNTNNVRYSFYIRSKETELTEDQIDDIKDNIRETMTRVYKSEIKNIKEEEKIIMDIMKTKFGRDYFIKAVISGNKKERVIKSLQQDSFDFFRYVIFNSLLNILGLEENYENIKYAMKLTKACLYIKTIINKKEILLSDILFSGLENYSLFTTKIFWEIWIEDDMTESDIEIAKLIRKLKKEELNIDIDNDNCQLYLKHSYDIIDKLSSTMIKMRLSNPFIYSTISELIQEYIINDEQFDQLMKELINELQFYKKLSNK